MASKSSKRRKMDIGVRDWNRFIEPYVRVAATNKGFIAKLTSAFHEEGYKVKSQLVYQWLVDNENRVQPRVGAGLVLMRLLPRVVEQMGVK